MKCPTCNAKILTQRYLDENGITKEVYIHGFQPLKCELRDGVSLVVDDEIIQNRFKSIVDEKNLFKKMLGWFGWK